MVTSTMSHKKDNPLKILSRKGADATASPKPSLVFRNKGRAVMTPEGRRPTTTKSVAPRASTAARLMGVEGTRGEERPPKRGRRSSESDAQPPSREKIDAMPFMKDGRFASAKYREPPEPAVLPLPPLHWVRNCNSDNGHKLALDLKTLLRVSAVEA